MPEYTQRALTVTLRKDNIDQFENMSCDEIIAYVEKLDDDYYKAIPSINELAEIYGNKENEQLYRLRDLFWMWQKDVYKRQRRGRSIGYCGACQKYPRQTEGRRIKPC